jgi:putative phosphoribosyl transferase
MTNAIRDQQEVLIRPEGLEALFGLPDNATGVVIFAHGSGSGRLSPRNNHVARALREAGLATLLLDLLTPLEEADRANVFDIGLLAARLLRATAWVHALAAARDLPIGYFGASTGAGAALLAAAAAPVPIGAVVSRGGRPDLAGAAALARVTAPTQLIVGSLDTTVIELNREAMRHLTCPHELVLVPGAGHLFEEPGTLDEVIDHARRWFLAQLTV